VHSAPYPQPARRNATVVIRDAVGSSSALPSRVKKEELPNRVKKEEPEEEEEEWEQISLELLDKMQPWWVKHRELQATLSRHRDDLADASGQTLAVATSLVMMTRTSSRR
jgi:hypothetical protein